MLKSKIPILFLHGWGGDKDSFLPIQKYFENFCECISLTLPVPTDEVWTLQDYADYVCQHIKGKVNIIAHSFGGRIALLLSSTTDLVNKQVLTGCAGLKPRFSFKVWVRRLRRIPSEDYKKLNNIQKQTFKNILNLDLKPYLKHIDASTLLVFGSKDTATPIYMAKTLNNNIKKCKLVIYKKNNHFAYLQSINRFIKDCETFLFKD